MPAGSFTEITGYAVLIRKAGSDPNGVDILAINADGFARVTTRKKAVEFADALGSNGISRRRMKVVKVKQRITIID